MIDTVLNVSVAVLLLAMLFMLAGKILHRQRLTVRWEREQQVMAATERLAQLRMEYEASVMARQIPARPIIPVPRGNAAGYRPPDIVSEQVFGAVDTFYVPDAGPAPAEDAQVPAADPEPPIPQDVRRRRIVVE